MRLTVIAALLFAIPACAADLPDFTELAVDNKPAVVNISTTRQLSEDWQGLRGFDLPEGGEGPLGDWLRRFFEGPGSPHGGAPETQSLGSGFVISGDGYIITNHHVVDGANEIVVRLDDRRELAAELIGSDKRSDIAVLKIEAEDLPVVKLGDSADLKVGEWVLAIGSPFGFDYSVTSGIVSAKGRSLPNENYVPFIQTDVAINPGNSGGPLFNMDGEVVGVNSQIYSRTGGFMGLSFAVPIELALDVAEQLKTKGRVSRGWLGVLIQEVTRELAESFGMDKPQGALVSQVMPDSPAAEAGLKTGDVILEFNGRQIKRSGELPPLVGKFPVGDKAQLKVMRDERVLTLKVKIGELPAEEQQAAAPGRSSSPVPGEDTRLGVVVREPSPQVREQLEIGDTGVEIVEVRRGPAAAAGIRRGDIITRVNNKTVTGVKDFLKIVENLEAGSSVALLVQRSGGPIYLALRIPENE